MTDYERYIQTTSAQIFAAAAVDKTDPYILKTLAQQAEDRAHMMAGVLGVKRESNRDKYTHSEAAYNLFLRYHDHNYVSRWVVDDPSLHRDSTLWSINVAAAPALEPESFEAYSVAIIANEFPMYTAERLSLYLKKLKKMASEWACLDPRKSKPHYLHKLIHDYLVSMAMDVSGQTTLTSMIMRAVEEDNLPALTDLLNSPNPLLKSASGPEPAPAKKKKSK